MLAVEAEKQRQVDAAEAVKRAEEAGGGGS